MKREGTAVLLSVKDIITNCDMKYLLDGVASCLGYRSSYQRSKLDSKTRTLLSQIQNIEVSCNPEVLLLEYTGMADGFLTSYADLFYASDIKQNSIYIPAWSRVMPCLFPEDEPDDGCDNLLALDQKSVLGLTVHSVNLLRPISWMQSDIELVLGASVYYTSRITQDILACDILAQLLLKSGVQRNGAGGARWIALDPFSIPIVSFTSGGMESREFEELRDDLYTMISLYHEIYRAHNELYKKK